MLSYSGVSEVVGVFSSVKDDRSYVPISCLVTAETVLHHSGGFKKRQMEKEIGRHKNINDRLYDSFAQRK